MIKIVTASNTPKMFFLSGAAVTKGELVKIDSGKAIPLATAHTGETVLGLAEDTATGADSLIRVSSIRGVLMEIDYLASASKQSLADADCVDLFDINVTSHVMTLDLDDTTGGICRVVRYDNTNKRAWVCIPDTLIYLSV